MADNHKQWHEKLLFALLGYCTTICTSTEATPYLLVYGIEAVIPAKVEIHSLRIIQQAKLSDAEWIRSRYEQLSLIDKKRMNAMAEVESRVSEFKDVYGGDRAKCKHCGRDYKANSRLNGTTSLNTHLKKCPKIPRKVDNTQTQLCLQKDGQINGGVLWKFDQELVRRALVEMVIMEELPFSFVEKKGFKKFMSIAQPLFNVPSRRTITRDCFQVYNEERLKLMKIFRDVKPKICLTTDTLTSLQRINYMCLTDHFIDRDWVLHKRILNFCLISSHKGDEMAKVIANCLLEWKLDKVFTITVDNASSNDFTVKELSKQLDMWKTNSMGGKHLHVRCMAHILNLIVQDGLKEIDVSVKRVRQAMRYMRSSPQRTLKFRECCAHQEVECSKILCLDVPIRWNSTYLMLETAQNFEKAFDKLHLFDDGFSTHLCTHVCEDGNLVDPFVCDDWVNVRNVIKFLERFHELTEKVSGSCYVTSNCHFKDICELDSHLKTCLASDNTNLRKMAEKMKEKFKKYWGEPQKMNKMIFIAFVLDPHKKFDYVGFALEEMFGKEPGKKLIAEVDANLNSLFGEYQKKYSKGCCLQSFPSKSTSSDDTSDLSSVNVRTKQLLKRQKEDSESVGAKYELERNIGEGQEPFSDDSDDFKILDWRKINAPRFPVLSELARDVLVIPISSVVSECAFSTSGRILDSFRSSLTPRLMQSLVCVQDWFRCDDTPINVEEDLEFLEQIELGSTMPRGPKARSPIWEHCELVEANEQVRKAKCLHCGRVCNCHPKYVVTMCLVKHIKKCLNPHPVIPYLLDLPYVKLFLDKFATAEQFIICFCHYPSTMQYALLLSFSHSGMPKGTVVFSFWNAKGNRNLHVYIFLLYAKYFGI
ncbi:zinc finger BED domain-containing protein RICESLEEPER 2-like [Nicotiana tabacum]|uniref:Zinc finger BED domain-containing protein RICESLEEPER 2-like n=1 Tax=Nicotiana tabacum TaxID=4097 RepID=A0AC58TQF1_TOBAC